MRRYLVVANETLDSELLLETMLDRLALGPSRFHLVVPENHGSGWVWDENEVRATTETRMEDARLRLLRFGIPVTGEVGHSGPVGAVSNVLAREGARAYDEIIVSTLPTTVSHWLAMDAPARIRRLAVVPVTVLTALDRAFATHR